MITADTESDMRLVIATARAVFAAGGKPLRLIRTAALKADAWVEFNRQYFLYSDTYQKAVEGNPKLRFLGLPGTTSDVFVRLYARVDQRVWGIS